MKVSGLPWEGGGVAQLATVSGSLLEAKQGAGKPWNGGRWGDSARPQMVKSLFL